MSAPIGNQFWKLRKDFDGDGKKLSIEQIYERTQEYIDFCINNPLIEVDFRGKDATPVNVPHMRAMTTQGLCHHLGISEKTLDNWSASDEKYLRIITQVKQLMYAYKFEGAAAGMLNFNIIARELGLSDKKEIDVKTEQPLFGDSQS